MLKIKRMFLLSLSALLAISLAACGSVGSSGSSGGSEDAFFEGETVEILVPFSAGGGTDTLFRFLSTYFNEHIEGEPAIQVMNIEGGGSITGANEYVNLKKPNGYNLLATSASTTIPFLIGQEAVAYDLRKLQPIMGTPNGVVLYTSPKTGLTEGKDLLDTDEELILGGTSPTGIDVMTLLGFEVLGISDKVKIVFGYEGAGASRIAFEQGETNLDYQSGTAYQSDVTPMVEAGDALPLFTYGFTGADGDIVRDPAFPDIPTIKEVYEDMYGEEPSGEAWEAYKAFVGVVNNLHKSLWVHADAPEEAVEQLREGAAAAIEDSQFKEESGEVLGGYEPVVGEELESAISALNNIDEDVMTWVKEFLEEEYDVTGLK
jgi:tripartite-type tricarboxylate transporter receptor subunit TctC